MPSLHDLLNLSYNSGRILIEYDVDENIKYLGAHHEFSALDTHLKWEIKRFWYEDGNLVQIKRQHGAWSDRASLSW